jgi:predicted lipid-binding transport protein (Tim44 family)
MKWLLLLLLLCGVAIARPGGGQTFSSESSHSSSSSSSSGGDYRSSSSGGGYNSSSSSGGSSYSSGGGSATAGQTAIGIIILLGVSLGVFVLVAKVTAQAEKQSTYTSASGAPPGRPKHAVSLGAVMKVDPDFSRVIFEDFAYELYAAAQRARHDTSALAKLAPYLSQPVRTELHKRHTEVEQVVIGSMHLVRVFNGEYEDYKATRIIVRFEANLANRKGSTFAVEKWVFERAVDRKTTPPPSGSRTWPCPNCGAPWTAEGNTCAHCNLTIPAGRLDWAVIDIEVEAETSVGVTLTGETQEIGNDFPTVETGDPHADLQKLRTDDPAVTWPSFEERVKFVYARLNDAWNAQDLSPVRGLVTHSLMQYLQYWIDEYKRQELHNRLDDAKVKRIVLAAVTRDAYYDAITARVYAGGRDYTLDDKKKVVGGHRDKNRNYTEYWTFIRSAKRRGATVAAPNCSNCGAPLSISNAGACTHCNAHVEAGEFDWVLSRIEQDDVYRG